MKFYRSASFTQILSIVISIVILSGFAFLIHISMPVDFEEKWVEIEIPEGSTYYAGTRILKDNGIINNRTAFLLLGKLTGADRHIKAGYYNLSASMSPLQTFEYLIKGRTVSFTITIPEGSDLRSIRWKLQKADLIDDESWPLVYDRDFLDSLNINAPSLEGYLYPDTYSFAKGADPKKIFKIMVQRMREKFDESLRSRAEKIGMSENDVLTLASIIEKEAIYNRERPLISAVYHNRLKQNMRLQADPTVLYGVDKKSRRIGYSDLRRTTPFNTYRINGLPPGPIASPGLRSILAAIYPAFVDYLFFVSRNDGTHQFSRTNDEHNEAVLIYQLNGEKKVRNDRKKTDQTDNSG